MPLLFALGLLILAEIALYVTLGAAIGLWLTLAVVIGTGVAGVLIVRAQGRAMQRQLVEAVMERRNPLPAAGEGVLRVLAGILLILPGFLTDFAGLLLLLPPVRRLILQGLAGQARRHVGDLEMTVVRTAPPGSQPGSQSGPYFTDTIDGEIVEDEPPADAIRHGRRPSGWTRN